MASQALQHDVFPGDAFFEELGQGFGVGGEHGGAVDPGQAQDYGVHGSLADICLTEGLPGAFALWISGAQGVAVDVAAVLFAEIKIRVVVFSIDLHGGEEDETSASDLVGQVQQMGGADDVCQYSPDRVGGVGDWMCVAGTVDHIVCVEWGEGQFLVDILGEILEIFPVPIRGKTGPGPLLAAADGVDFAVQAVQLVFCHQKVDEIASDHPCGSGDEDGAVFEFFPGEGQGGIGFDLF